MLKQNGSQHLLRLLVRTLSGCQETKNGVYRPILHPSTCYDNLNRGQRKKLHGRSFSKVLPCILRQSSIPSLHRCAGYDGRL